MFEQKNLAIVSNNGNANIWHYASCGEDLLCPNYFNAANKKFMTFTPGDMILWSDLSGAKGGLLLVSTAAIGRVIVTPLTGDMP